MFDGKSSIIIICVMVGSALKLGRRRLESGQCIVSMRMGHFCCLCIIYMMLLNGQCNRHRKHNIKDIMRGVIWR